MRSLLYALLVLGTLVPNTFASPKLASIENGALVADAGGSSDSHLAIVLAVLCLIGLFLSFVGTLNLQKYYATQQNAFDCFRSAVDELLANVPGDGTIDKVEYAAECFEDHDKACDLLDVGEGEELLPALKKLLAEREAQQPPVTPPSQTT